MRLCKCVRVCSKLNNSARACVRVCECVDGACVCVCARAPVCVCVCVL